jgi:hypothetical protein
VALTFEKVLLSLLPTVLIAAIGHRDQRGDPSVSMAVAAISSATKRLKMGMALSSRLGKDLSTPRLSKRLTAPDMTLGP